MMHFLKSLLTSLYGRRRRRSVVRREYGAWLHVETMEERLSPSTALAGLPAAPAVSAPLSGTTVELPDQVRGYKHRGRCPPSPPPPPPPHLLATGSTEAQPPTK